MYDKNLEWAPVKQGWAHRTKNPREILRGGHDETIDHLKKPNVSTQLTTTYNIHNILEELLIYYRD